jgi:hypothetical protein
LVLKPDEDSLARAERERLGEDLRLLYVALTRARHACWLGVADLKIGNGKKSRLHESALGYLLGGGEPLMASAGLADWLAPFVDGLESAVAPVPPASEQRYRMLEERQFEPQWRTPARRAAEHWWIASYSALRLDEELTNGVFTAVVPIHDPSASVRLLLAWSHPFSFWPSQPLDEVRDYLGGGIASYFAFVELLAKALLLPAVAGVLLTLHDALVIGRMDSGGPLHALFALLLLLWMCAFAKLWRRREARLAFRWGHDDPSALEGGGAEASSAAVRAVVWGFALDTRRCPHSLSSILPGARDARVFQRIPSEVGPFRRVAVARSILVPPQTCFIG